MVTIDRKKLAEILRAEDDSDVGGIGDTLAGNALSIAAMRVTLENVLTEPAY